MIARRIPAIALAMAGFMVAPNVVRILPEGGFLVQSLVLGYTFLILFYAFYQRNSSKVP